MNNKEIDISVIIPVYNGAKFIFCAYNCIINQGIESIEIIFIDNNSTDDSVSIIKELIDKDKRVSLYHEPKQGAGAARNKGISKSKGKYIHFYDVDDRMYMDAYIKLKYVLDNYPQTDSVFGKTFKAYESFEDTTLPKQGDSKITHYNKPELAKLLLTTNSVVPGTLAYLHRKQVFDVIGGFPENIRLGEDVFFHLKLTLHMNLSSIDRYVSFYYRHPESTVSLENKKGNDKIYTYWSQYSKAYLPYYLNNSLPSFYRIELTKLLYGAMAKMLALSNGFKNRIQLFKQLKKDILPLKVPVELNFFLKLIVITGSFNLYKFYYHYVLTKFLNKFLIKRISD